MEYKRNYIFIILSLIFIHFAVSQNTTDSNENLWYQVTDFSQLDGRWSSNFSQTQTQSGVTILIRGSVTLIFDSSENVFTQDMLINTSFSGLMARLFWGVIKNTFVDSIGYNVEIDDSNRTITIIENAGPRVLDDEEKENIINSTMINQNGTRIKWSDDQFEIILTKR